MNLINKGFLRLALLPRPIYNRLGVNTAHLRSILITKLTIDDRRPNTFHQTRKRKPEKPINAATIGTIFVSAILGVIYLVAFTIGQDIITKLSFYFSFFFFMLAASLISDFTAVLIDVRDNYILLPRPVDDRTLVMARILHIFIHICKLIVPMCLPALVLMVMRYGIWGGTCFLLMVLMVTLFTIFFINALYIIILRITTPQKFQAIISYVQVFFAIILYGSYQILPRLMANFDEISFKASSNLLFAFLPSYWFASGWNVLYSFNGTTQEYVTAAISILFPVASLYMVIKYLAPSFNNKLTMISSTSSESTPEKKSVVEKDSSYSHFLSKLITRPGPERMGFLFTWKMSARSRDFRLKVYPSIGYIFIYVVIVLFGSKDFSLNEIGTDGNRERIVVVTALYICSYLPVMAITQSNFSEKFRAGWIFYTTPVSKPGDIIIGSVKASVLKFFLPLAAAIVIASLLLIGVKAVPNIVLGLINQILLSSIVAISGQQQLPFTTHEGVQRKTGAFIRGLVSLLASGMVGLLHYFIFNNMPVVIISIALSAIATWLLMDAIKRITWEKIKHHES